MAKFSGVVKKNPLEGGIWQLVAGDGKIYQLSGGDAALHKEGARVEIDGKVDKQAFGIGMSAPTLAVTSYKIL